VWLLECYFGALLLLKLTIIDIGVSEDFDG
jgi:hypothetical protein